MLVFTVITFTTEIGVRDSAYNHKKHWSTLVEKGYVGKFLGHVKIDYGNAGILYAWYLDPKIKFGLVNIDYGGISAKRSSKGSSK